MKEILLFLSQVRDNNNREWLEGNKVMYEKTRQHFHDFVAQLLTELRTFEPALAPLEPKNCIFRFYRDVRFSKDKTPYKTNYSAYFAEGGKKSTKAGYYVSIEPGGKTMIAGGMYMPIPEELKKIRQEIDYNGAALHHIIENKKFKQYYGEISGGKLKTTPKGYDASHPDIELLKLKDFTGVHYVSDQKAASANFKNYVASAWQALKPLNDFMNRAVE
jgi:uncharacterized protein (TIGR02453 family)